MAKGRRNGSQRRITKAVNPNFAQMLSAAPRGLQPVQRGFPLLDAINLATGGRAFEPLPRDPFNTTAFGPMDPLIPDPIDGIGPDGRSNPRTWEYTVGWNLPGSGNREVPWQVLQGAALGVGIIRRCIEVRKKHVRALDWSFGPTQRAITQLYEEDPSKGKLEAERQLRERLMPEIRRLEERWERPWPGNGLSFGQWVNGVIENYLKFDAVVVYPQMSFGNEVLNLQLIDPSTIKRLVDQYGNTPQSPHPAFQQILYGFPRGEWAASVTQDDEGNEVLENGFAASEMFYYLENYRTDSPYGLSAVEQALIDARLYLKRQQWMLAEYDDGSTPLVFLETPLLEPGQEGLNLTQARQWIAALNQKNAGNTSARQGMKPLPNGWKPVPLPGIDERYRPEYDLFLIKLLCSYFGVPASELGFSENNGLGGKGWSEGQADVSGRVGQRPDTAVVGDIINSVSRQFLRMPKEIAFSFTDPTGVNDQETAAITVGQINSGQITVNDARDALGKARLPFAEADMPFIVGGPSGIIFLEGAKAAADAAVQQAQIAAEATAAGTVGKLELEGKKLEDGKEARAADHELQRETRDLTLEAQQAQADTKKYADTDAGLGEEAALELAAYRNWRRKNREPRRPFVFKHVTPDMGLQDVPPHIADFGSEYVWLEEEYELEKRAKSGLTWEAWNAANPTRPKDAKGRWVKASSLVSALSDQVKQDAKRERQSRIDRVRAVSTPATQMYMDASSGMPESVNKLDDADTALRAAGATLFAMPETVHRFDRNLHKPIGDEWPKGKVYVVRPGVRWDEEGIVLDKAVVMPFDGDEAGIAAFWADQEIDVHQLMKERERSWQALGESTTMEPVIDPDLPGSPERTERLMERAKQGLASSRLSKLGAVQKDILRSLGNSQRVPEGARGAKGMSNLLKLSEHRDYYELTDLGWEAWRQLVSPSVTKAAEPGDGGAGPKAPELVPVPPDQRWPGWLTDLAIAAAVAPALLAGMRGLLTSATLLSLIRRLLALEVAPVPPAGPGRSALQAIVERDALVADITARVRAEPGLVDEVVRAITPAIRAAHLEGTLTGERSAQALLEWVGAGNDARGAVSFEIDWGSWEPGHPEAAQLLLRPEGLEQLLRESDITIRGIAANRLNRLGEIIGQGLARGDAPKTIGRVIAAEFGNESWAHMVALTETNRAQSAAAVKGYERAGMMFKGWMTANDQRVCPTCHKNEKHRDGTPRVVAIGDRFPSGDLWPPGHPRCRCAPIPVIQFMRTMSPDRAVGVFNEPS